MAGLGHIIMFNGAPRAGEIQHSRVSVKLG